MKGALLFTEGSKNIIFLGKCAQKMSLPLIHPDKSKCLALVSEVLKHYDHVYETSECDRTSFMPQAYCWNSSARES
jgi:hypothetical protein